VTAEFVCWLLKLDKYYTKFRNIMLILWQHGIVRNASKYTTEQL